MATTEIKSSENASPPLGQEELAHQIAALGDWFHNLNLKGIQTAPNHFLGDFPYVKWKGIASEFPQDMTGATVLDLGCNGGFYALELKRRGADRVLGIDVDERYLRQAKFAANVLGLSIEFEKCSVYNVDRIPGQFDYVLFMGVFYHLRYPIYALDQIVKKIKGKLVFQTMIRGSLSTPHLQEDYHFWDKEIFLRPDFPGMYFIEKSYAGDPTNWWIPNHGGMEAILRSSGLKILSHPEEETWVCSADNVQKEGRYILDHELAGTL
ncbi:MAG TPA: TIGR04290 family methyltransferase [Candidatus Angelobacter sp.]|nr:TIGR04290 family methyltransferase [Candidatus Angelobacter sp.]